MSPYWLPSWCRLWAGERELVFVSAGGVDGPLLVEDRVAWSPPGDVGLAGDARVELVAFEAALLESGVRGVVAKTDPHAGRGLADAAISRGWAVTPEAGSVLVDLTTWTNAAVAKNHRRTLVRAERAGYVGVELPIERFDEVWAAYDATVGRVRAWRCLTRHQMWTFLYETEAEVRLYGALSTDGVVAASDIVLVHDGVAANPWGGSLDTHRDASPSVVSQITVLECLRAEGVEVLNLGGGIAPGDPLETYKLRFGGELVPTHVMRWPR